MVEINKFWPDSALGWGPRLPPSGAVGFGVVVPTCPSCSPPSWRASLGLNSVSLRGLCSGPPELHLPAVYKTLPSPTGLRERFGSSQLPASGLSCASGHVTHPPVILQRPLLLPSACAAFNVSWVRESLHFPGFVAHSAAQASVPGRRRRLDGDSAPQPGCGPDGLDRCILPAAFGWVVESLGFAK